MTHYWFERARTVPKPVQEKMALFWHGLLCSGLNKVSKHYLRFDQIRLFRTQGMGNVVDLKVSATGKVCWRTDMTAAF